MNEDYFKSLDKGRLVEVAQNLHQLAVEQWEKINSNSSNSSQPPSADWLRVSWSVGTIDRCIREAGIACEAVVEELLAQLQQASILHIDETPWYQKGKLYWLWVAIESKTAVFPIAPRTKEEFQYLS